MYEPLLDNIDTEMLINEDNFEVDTGSRDRLQGVKQEDPVLKDKRKLAAQEKPGTSGEEQVDGRSRHCGHMVIDSTNETTYW